MLETDEELNITNFIGVENGMLIRQRILVEKLQKLQKEKDEEIELTEAKMLEDVFQSRKISLLLCKGGNF